MKKIIILFAFVTLLMVCSYVVFANERMGGGMMRGGENRQQGMGQQSMMGGMRGHNMMGEDMMRMGTMMDSSSIVATRDGGVVILMGNELFKYNEDLELVKQTDVKFNWENWHKMMMQHRNMMMGEQSEEK